MGRNKFFEASEHGVFVEYPVGQRIVINGVPCVVKEDSKWECESCECYRTEGKVRCANLSCWRPYRRDGKSVHFERLGRKPETKGSPKRCEDYGDLASVAIGDRAEVGGRLVEVVDVSAATCADCAFDRVPCNLIPCGRAYRTDQRSVIYKLIRKQ